MTPADVRRILAEVLGQQSAPGVGAVNVLDRPPGQIAGSFPVRFFDGRKWERDDQAGGVMVTIPVVTVCGSIETDASHDIADRCAPGGDLSLIDYLETNDLQGRDLSVRLLDGAESVVEVAGIQYVAIIENVEVHF